MAAGGRADTTLLHGDDWSLCVFVPVTVQAIELSLLLLLSYCGLIWQSVVKEEQQTESCRLSDELHHRLHPPCVSFYLAFSVSLSVCFIGTLARMMFSSFLLFDDDSIAAAAAAITDC